MFVFKDIGFQQLNSQISILDKGVEKNKNDIARGGGAGDGGAIYI